MLHSSWGRDAIIRAPVRDDEESVTETYAVISRALDVAIAEIERSAH